MHPVILRTTGPYHESEYGFSVADAPVLFERLTLEVMQAGLSWLTVLKKRSAFTRVFANFDVAAVAAASARPTAAPPDGGCRDDRL